MRLRGNGKPEFWMAERTRSLASCAAGSDSPTIENAGMPRDVGLDIDSSSVVEHLLTEQRVSGTAGSCGKLLTSDADGLAATRRYPKTRPADCLLW